MLLPALPPKHRYKVIFMMRPIAEVMASQQAMTSRLGTRRASLDHDQLERGLRAHREEMRRWGKTTPDVEWLEVDYPALVSDPALVITQLVEFLGGERLPNEEAMAAVIDPALYRRKEQRRRESPLSWSSFLTKVVIIITLGLAIDAADVTRLGRRKHAPGKVIISRSHHPGGWLMPVPVQHRTDWVDLARNS